MIYFLIVNVLAFWLCFLDKWKAILGRWRIPEYILLGICLIGGCFGMAIGMRLVHHKTRKKKFRVVYLYCLIWGYFLLWYFR